MLIKAERNNAFKRRQNRDRLVANHQKETFESDFCNESDENNYRESNHEIQLNQMKKILWNLSRYHLEVNDWKRLARIWDFTEEQIKGEQYKQKQ